MKYGFLIVLSLGMVHMMHAADLQKLSFDDKASFLRVEPDHRKFPTIDPFFEEYPHCEGVYAQSRTSDDRSGNGGVPFVRLLIDEGDEDPVQRARSQAIRRVQNRCLYTAICTSVSVVAAVLIYAFTRGNS